MKITTKLLATCAALGLLAIGTAAQAVLVGTVPFSEGFESSTVDSWPINWELNILGAQEAPLVWVVRPFAYEGTKSVRLNSQTRSGITRLSYKGLFDFSGYDSLTMSFAMEHDQVMASANDRVQWQYKTLTGVWTNIGGEKSRYQATGGLHWDKETFDFSGLANKTGVQIGLLGTSELGSNIYIDSISLTSGSAVPEPATLLGFGVPMLMVGLGKLRGMRK